MAEPTTEEPAVEETETKPPAKKQSTRAKRSTPKAAESPPKLDVADITDNHNLPKGWMRKAVTRKSGKSAGMIDVYIYR